MSSNEYVAFPVRVEFVPDVTALCARLEAVRNGSLTDEQAVTPDGTHIELPGGGTPAQPGSRGGSAANKVEGDGVVWTPEQYALLRDNTTVSASRIHKILDTLAEAGGERVTTTVLSDRTGVRDTEIRHALGWLTKFMRGNPNVFDSDQWPMGWAYGREIDPDNAFEFHYRMTAEQIGGWTGAPNGTQQ